MKKNTTWLLAVSFVLAAAGFLLPFWPLSAAGILVLACSGRFILAIALGLLLDIAYGAPIGRFHFLFFPFIILAAAGGAARYAAMHYLRKSPTDTL
ncbi:MAG: hypothetical protein KGH79_01135 [Patescibacteria group bacterium]|nr:hypothetical protein [Patescibacteria group bacterium]